VQAALTSAFGANTWVTFNHPYYGNVIIGLGANATVSTPLTMAQTGGTGTATVFQYLGDIAPNVPKNAAGQPLPFVIFVQGTGNDDGQSTLGTVAAAEYAGLASTFPTATILATGRWMNQGPQTSGGLVTNAYLQTASASLTTYFGVTPFVNLFNSSSGVGYLNGTTNIGSPSGAAGINTDQYVYYDGTHPSGVGGHYYLANVIAKGLFSLFGNP
jgi:hypothetical protein